MIKYVMHEDILPDLKSFKTNGYQTRTVNIKPSSFLRYPFVTSGLGLSVLYRDDLMKIGLVKTFDRLIIA